MIDHPRIRIFLFTSVLYAATMAIGLIAAWRQAIAPAAVSLVAPLELTPLNIAVFVAVFAVFTLLMVRFVRTARLSLAGLLMIALIAGAQFVFGAWVSWPGNLALALLLVLLLRLAPFVLVHDLAIAVGIGGIAAVLGLSITPPVAAVLLCLLSVYDIWSVYRTKHMVTLAGRMMSSGAVFGFLVPARARDFLLRRDGALNARAVMMLGSGDIGLPLVLAASAVSQSIVAALMVAGCSMIGLLVMHWLFLRQEMPAPMAALPPIAVSAILGYVAAVLLGI